MIFPTLQLYRRFHLTNGKPRDFTTRFSSGNPNLCCSLSHKIREKLQDSFQEMCNHLERHYRVRTNGQISRTLRHFNTILDPLDLFEPFGKFPRSPTCTPGFVRMKYWKHSLVTLQTVDTKYGLKIQHSTKLLIKTVLKASKCQKTSAKLMQFLGLLWALIRTPQNLAASTVSRAASGFAYHWQVGIKHHRHFCGNRASPEFGMSMEDTTCHLLPNSNAMPIFSLLLCCD